MGDQLSERLLRQLILLAWLIAIRSLVSVEQKFNEKEPPVAATWHEPKWLQTSILERDKNFDWTQWASKRIFWDGLIR